MSFYKISETKVIPWGMGCCYDDKLSKEGGRVANADDIFMIVSSDEQYNLLYNLTKNYTIHKDKDYFPFLFQEI